MSQGGAEAPASVRHDSKCGTCCGGRTAVAWAARAIPTSYVDLLADVVELEGSVFGGLFRVGGVPAARIPNLSNSAADGGGVGEICICNAVADERVVPERGDVAAGGGGIAAWGVHRRQMRLAVGREVVPERGVVRQQQRVATHWRVE